MPDACLLEWRGEPIHQWKLRLEEAEAASDAIISGWPAVWESPGQRFLPQDSDGHLHSSFFFFESLEVDW